MYLKLPELKRMKFFWAAVFLLVLILVSAMDAKMGLRKKPPRPRPLKRLCTLDKCEFH